MFRRHTGPISAFLLAVAFCATAAPSLSAPVFDEMHTVADGETAVAIERPFEVTAAGGYELTLTDLGVPAALDSVTAAVTRGDTVVATLTTAGVQTVQLEAGSHVVRIVGKPEQSGGAGNVGFKVRRPADDTVLLELVQSLLLAPAPPSPDVTLLDTTLTISNAGDYDLTLTDFQTPQALVTLRAGVLPPGGGALLVDLGAAGTATFSAMPGDYRVLAAGESQPGGRGLFGLEIRPHSGGDALLGTVKTVGGSAGITPGYQYNVNITNAGTYRIRIADFEFPGAVSALHLAAVQNGAVLGSLDAAGSLNVTAAATAAAGPLVLAVVAQSGTASGALLGIDVAPAAGGDALFEITQGVGALFDAGELNIVTAGRYDISLADIGFPAPFKELSAIVTRGTEWQGKIFGGGEFAFDATPGRYFVNFVATPQVAGNAGTYHVTAAAHPASSPPDDPPPTDPAKHKGGGAFDWLSLAAVGLAALSRFWHTTPPVFGNFGYVWNRWGHRRPRHRAHPDGRSAAPRISRL